MTVPSYATPTEYYDWIKVDNTKGSPVQQNKAEGILNIILDAASRAVETCTETYFYTYKARVQAKRHVGSPSNIIRVPTFQSLTEVKDHTGATILDFAPYREDPSRPFCYVFRDSGYWSTLHYSFFSGNFGYDAVPNNVKLATLLITGKLYNRPHTPSGIEAGALFIARNDPDVQRLLSEYIKLTGSNRTIHLIAGMEEE